MTTTLRTSPRNHSEVKRLTAPQIVVDLMHREVRHGDGRRCRLSKREAGLLACLARKVGIPVSREELLSEVWRLNPDRTLTRTVDMHVSMLRRKLGDPARTPAMLLTVNGTGYMLRADAADGGGLFSTESIPTVRPV
jgi:DNA-binding response OmpR family regulator